MMWGAVPVPHAPLSREHSSHGATRWFLHMSAVHRSGPEPAPEGLQEGRGQRGQGQCTGQEGGPECPARPCRGLAIIFEVVNGKISQIFLEEII